MNAKAFTTADEHEDERYGKKINRNDERFLAKIGQSC
jgi:hypothetical protein